MRFDETTLSYLRNEQFDSGLRVGMDFEPSDFVLRSRSDWLVSYCRGKSVIHVGCVDHSPQQIEAKRKRGKWLHEQLAQTASLCHGVDLNAEGIDYLRTVLGYEDVEALNLLEDDSPTIAARQWDILLLGEVLEHIDDPTQFLRRLLSRYASRIGELVITVPNAFAADNFKRARRGQEAINSDHRYWFTPYTLAKVTVMAGWRPVHMAMCRNGIIKKRSVLKNFYLSRRPLLRNNLVLVARPGSL